MTPEQKKLQKKIERLGDIIAQEVGSSTKDMINELIEANIQLEALCNQ